MTVVSSRFNRKNPLVFLSLHYFKTSVRRQLFNQKKDKNGSKIKRAKKQER